MTIKVQVIVELGEVERARADSFRLLVETICQKALEEAGFMQVTTTSEA